MSSKYKADTVHKTKQQYILFTAGLVAVFIGISIAGRFCIRELYREYLRQKLMCDNPVVEITDLKIKAPILEGTDNATLSIAAGHFIETGDFSKGNYCIAGHSSAIYKEYFNNLKNAKNGMKVRLYDKGKNYNVYTVSDSFIVAPDETWVLNDFDDNRITLITCTDDGTMRQVVIAKLDQVK